VPNDIEYTGKLGKFEYTEGGGTYYTGAYDMFVNQSTRIDEGLRMMQDMLEAGFFEFD